MAKEMSGKLKCTLGKQPSVLRDLSQKLSRGFNDAINSFSDDGWSLVDYDAAEDLIICVNSTKKFGTDSNYNDALPLSGGILCVKSSMVLQASDISDYNGDCSISGGNTFPKRHHDIYNNNE
ncbi:unnamed protein product [Ilex paraguariensis]|uniref:Uncharacterized protein n=1 Tax=Ilex paraguariensis TaxID=185542 RepID=A0ABC8TMS5_9AQUA